MKKLFISILFFLSLMSCFCFSQDNFQVNLNTKRPTVWGKILKTKKKAHGYQYFVYFKQNGQDLVYPLSTSSNLNAAQLDNLQGKYAKIYGSTRFEAIDLDSTKHIMTFVVTSARELNLADLNQDYNAYKERMDIKYLLKRRQQTETYRKEGLSDKVINSAIFVGGAVLAAEILGILLSQ